MAFSQEPQEKVSDVEWRNIPGDKYEVSDTGLIRNRNTGALLKPFISQHGYAHIDLCHDGKRTRHAVHRLVAAAFIPNPDNLGDVNHKNGAKLDNCRTNLEWMTRKDNIRHAYRTGIHKVKLTYEQALEIRERAARGILSNAEIAHFYGVSREAVYQIVSNRTHKPIGAA